MGIKKRLGVLTSGGDAPGMNAAVRGVVRAAYADGIECVGIRRGYSGLINGDVEEMDSRSVDGLITRGGTKLYTARSEEFKTEEGLNKAVETCRYLGLDGIIGIGGDGTFRGLRALSSKGVCAIGIPATIDNDIACTNYTIGFDTACNTAIEAIDKLRDTMQSHERCSVVEVMGRAAGHLALYVGIASGATAVLLPEREFDFNAEITEKIRQGRIHNRRHHIIIVSEGVGKATEIAEQINKTTGIETRVTILGHIQRGGSPTARDRVTATRMGVYAEELFKNGASNRIVAISNGILCDYDIDQALSMHKDLLAEMYNASQKVSI